MELDDFKQLYKQTNPGDSDTRSAGELADCMRSKTHSITGKVKRSILLEFAVAVIFVALAVWTWFVYPSRLARPFAMLTIALCCIFFLYLGALYKKILVYEQTPPAVKDSLRQVITILRQFTRLYFQFTMISLPIVFIFGLIAGYLNINGDPGIGHFNWFRGIVFYTIAFTLWCIVIYFFTRWYIKKLYGNYLSQLQQQLKDIENG